MPKDRVGDQVCELYQAGRFRVQKQRHFGQVPQDAPAMSDRPEVASEALDGGLVRRLVEDDYAAWVSPRRCNRMRN